MQSFMRSSARNTFILSGIALPLLATGYFFRNELFPDHDAPATVTQADTLVPTGDDTLITLIAVGDMMLGTNYPGPEFLPPNGQNILDPLKDILRNADLTFGNLEGT